MPSSSEGASDLDASELLARIWKLGYSVLEESAPAMEAMGLSPKTFFLLVSVEEAPFPAELARAMHLPPPTVTYMIKHLASLGYLERRAEPGDLRKFRLIVTEAGSDAIARSKVVAGAIMKARMASLSLEEVASLEDIVERLSRPAAD